MKKNLKTKDLIPEFTFHQVAADCFLLFEKYKLKTNVVALNLDKQMVHTCYAELEGRMIQRYDNLYEQLQAGINSLEKNFKIAKATHIRTLNNIMRNYRRRVGTLDNEPLTNFKYNRFDRSEKMLLESLVYNDIEGFDDIVKFKEELKSAFENGEAQVQASYKKNPLILEDYHRILEVIDKTECHSYKYYDNFERSMQNSISTLESYFDKLNGYLTVWENVGSIKAYEIKSVKELQMDERTGYNANKRFQEEYTEEQLEELMNSCPPNSFQREDYKRRLVELRQINKEKDRKMEMVGKMFNKRKNRAGILVNKRRDITILDWYYNLENEKSNFSFNDEFKIFNAENFQCQYRPTQYELQKPFRKEKLEQIQEHMQKYQRGSALNYEWWYDKFGKQGIFDLILCSSQQIQQRIQFEIVRQIDFQQTDDRRKRDVFDKHMHHIRDYQRRENMHIGYFYAYQKEQLTELQERTFNTQYFPDLMTDEVSSSSIEFSDEESQNMQEIQSKHSQGEFEPEEQTNKKDKKDTKIKQKTNYEQLVQYSIQKVSENVQYSIQKPTQPDDKEEEFQFNEFGDEQRLIKSYFQEYSLKVVRKEADPEYKKSKFLYFQDLNSVQWSVFNNYFECEKIFVYTKMAIVYLKRVFSAHQEKIKCTVYSLNEDIDEEMIKQNVTNCFVSLALVTVKFVPIFEEIEEQDRVYFMVGLMLILVRQGEMPQDLLSKEYIQQGKFIVDDFHCYYNPHSTISSRNLFKKRIFPVQAQETFKQEIPIMASDKSRKASESRGKNQEITYSQKVQKTNESKEEQNQQGKDKNINTHEKNQQIDIYQQTNKITEQTLNNLSSQEYQKGQMQQNNSIQPPMAEKDEAALVEANRSDEKDSSEGDNDYEL